MTFRAPTIGHVLSLSGYRPSGFDYLRIMLALGVFAMHVIGTSYGSAREVWSTGFGPVFRAILPMFFALSGFLVAGSMARCRTVVKFLGLRLLRIYPALAVEVLLSAFVIGPILTSYSLWAYFTDPLFWRYLVNVTGHISYFLPGLFADNPVPHYVNKQLWTVPWELDCYIVIGALMVLGAAHRRILAPLGALALFAWFAAPMLIRRGMVYENPSAMQGQLLVISFLFGLTIYLYRDRIPATRLLGAGSALLSYWLLSMPFNGATFIATVPVAYLTVYLGILNPPRVAVIRHADYSYGVFLYGAIIQQSFMSVPALREWYWNVLLALPTTIAFAALSWHWVEKPMLTFKGRLDGLETWWLRIWDERIRRLLPRLVLSALEHRRPQAAER